MNSINPYEPSPHDKDCLKRSRIALTSSEVFTVGVIISMLFVLLLAPGQSQLRDYTAIEAILLILTTNWFTSIAVILGFATLLTGAYQVMRSSSKMLNPGNSRSSEFI